MHRQNFQDILGLIEMPTRYLGNEINAVKKNHDAMDLTFALVFPDLYEIGTSHFGLQILYTILNNEPNIAAERVFTPAPDIMHLQKERRIPCLSMESKTPLKEFDIIGISLLYELNFTNILAMFHLSDIPFLARDRDDSFPLIIGGGPCAFNPEPLADFFDAFVIGDGEEVILDISNTVIQWKKQGDGKKKTLLLMLSDIQGVYIPSFFKADFDGQGIQQLTPLVENYSRIHRAILPDLENAVFPISPVVPFGKPVHDRLRLEIARGCSKGCRFCQAGMIYRPVRERSVQTLVDITQKSLKTTGYRNISLLSLSTGDYENLAILMETLLGVSPYHCNAISLPSIRAEKLSPELMEIIRKVRKTGFTIAPEAGSQRLRDVINKNLSESSIEDTVENAFNLGWKNIKLYFMMGLPSETREDIEAICTLSKKLASSKAKGKKNITVSVAPFIPKAHTPFQRCSQIHLQDAKENLQYLKDNLRHPKITLKWQNPEMSLIEGVWSRGDRRLSALLISAFNKGCHLDGWSDHFSFDLWQDAFMETGIDPEFYTTRKRTATERLPWDHIDSGISPVFIEKEYQNAMDSISTKDCRDSECSGCGICDFSTIQPKVYAHDSGLSATPSYRSEPLNDNDYFHYDIVFSKTGNARFFGHLELANIIQRAVRRAGLNVRYTEGFNPNMKLSFSNPLPVGMASEQESFFLYVSNKIKPSDIHQKLNGHLPDGLKVEAVRLFSKVKNKKKDDAARYEIYFNDFNIDPEIINSFMMQSVFLVTDVSPKGKKRTIDLRKSVSEVSVIDNQHLEIMIEKYNERTVRPGEILTKVFNVPESVVKMAVITKKKQDQ